MLDVITFCLTILDLYLVFKAAEPRRQPRRRLDIAGRACSLDFNGSPAGRARPDAP